MLPLIGFVVLLAAGEPASVRADAADTLASASRSSLAYTFADSGVFAHPGEDAGGLIAPSGLASDQFGHLWVSDTGTHRLQRWDAKGQWLGESGSLGSEANQFRRPSSVARLGSSGVAVLDVENRRIVTYDLLGRLAVVLTQLDAASLEDQTGPITPVALAADRGGALYVADGDRDRVLVFDFSGRYVRTVGSYGAAPGSFRGLQSIAVAPHGELVSIERRANLPRKRATAADSAAASGARVQRLDAGGTPLAAWRMAAGADDVFAIAVDDSGRVAVSSATTGTVRLFSREGVELARRDGLATPSALAFGPGGELYVAEAGQGHLRRLVLSAATKP